MTNNRILIPVDFTDAADNAIKFATIAARKGTLAITLLHVASRQEPGEPESKLAGLAQSITSESGVECHYLIRRGDLFEEIRKEACDACYRFMVIGTHGFKGLREKFLGSDILKLAKMLPIPAVVIQKDYEVKEDGISKIVFPAGTHKAFPQNIEATIMMAGLFGSEVHLYTVEKKGQDWSAELKKNIELSRTEFEKNNINYVRVSELQTTFSLGYSKQILQYARDQKADLIAVMSIPTPEHYYFADSDKELLLTNESHIPILTTSDQKAV
jgi:nucleotide-binding universal stress UspA family protein